MWEWKQSPVTSRFQCAFEPQCGKHGGVMFRDLANAGPITECVESEIRAALSPCLPSSLVFSF